MSDNIPIKNIYYMLSYAYQILNQDAYRNMATEEFKNLADMFSAIIQKGVESQLKRYLNREYLIEKDSLSVLRGKIEINDSINEMSFLKRRLVCSYDEYSVDSYMNRILKTTITYLLKADISKKRKQSLRKLLLSFHEVKTLDIYRINWNLHFNKSNQTYRMLMGICYLYLSGMIQTLEDGSVKLMDFIDEQKMCRLYEKFILEYYRKEHSGEFSANSKEIDWQLDNDQDEMLPTMKSDIMLAKGNKVLIMDAKFYSHSTQVQYEKHTVHSANLYQIFTYVKNKEVELSKENHIVSGMLLYAQNADNCLKPKDYQMSGNTISVRTLNLNCDFDEIRNQLDIIARNFFGEEEKLG